MATLDHLDIQWRRVSPAYIWLSLVGDLIWMLVFAAIAFVALVLEWPSPVWIVFAVLAVASLVSAALAVNRARAIGYALREDDLVFRRGLIWSRLVAVPYGRLQLVDVQRGPLARAFGLANVKLVTAAAASGVSIPGLPTAEADAMRDHLIRVAESRRAGL